MNTKKLLVILFAVTMLSIYGSSTAYGAITDTAATQTAQDTVTEDISNKVTDSMQPSESTIDDTEAAEDAPKDNVYVDELGQVYVDGQKVDEQGQIIEEDPLTEDSVVVEDKEDQNTDQSKNNNKKNEKKDSSDKASDSKDVPAAAKPSYSQKDLRLLASLIYAEAGNQSYNGMLAVANVVLNRVKSNVYWHVTTIKDVVYDRKWSVQFSVTIKNKKTGSSMLDRALKLYDSGTFTGSNMSEEEKLMCKAIKAAKAALEGENNIGNYLCFTNKRYSGGIKKHYPDYRIIGDHIFYRTK
jgi:spore germination cell wall hydrolase CwlJ-like protein